MAALVPSSGLMLFGDAELRRAITGSFKDGAFMSLAGGGALASW